MNMPAPAAQLRYARMNSRTYTPFKDIHAESIAEEATLYTLEEAYENALINDDWGLIAELEGQLRSQTDRVSMIFEHLKYLESN